MGKVAFAGNSAINAPEPRPAMTHSAGNALEDALFGLDRRNRADRPAISVVAPMFDEAGGAETLIAEIAAALKGHSFEIVAVDDNSRDHTRAALLRAAAATPELRIIAHGANAGQSRAVRTGVLAARAPVIATIDGDGQNDPADIPPLFAALTREDAPALLAMVAGERKARQDAASKKTASRIANWVRRRILDDGAADTGCGLKVFHREAYLRLPFFDHNHRYLPALMRREGFLVEFRPVGHRPRTHGRSKYTNLGRLAVAWNDISGVVWLKARARRPMTIYEVEPAASYDKLKPTGRPGGPR
jgi:glycosyltransferase involved in cell wall biosynthesis